MSHTDRADFSASAAAEALGAAIADARKRRRLTQQDLSELAGVGRLTVMRAEAGHPGLALGAFLSLLAALDPAMANRVLTLVQDDPAGAVLERDRAVLPTRVRRRKA